MCILMDATYGLWRNPVCEDCRHIKDIQNKIITKIISSKLSLTISTITTLQHPTRSPFSKRYRKWSRLFGAKNMAFSYMNQNRVNDSSATGERVWSNVIFIHRRGYEVPSSHILRYFQIRHVVYCSGLFAITQAITNRFYFRKYWEEQG